MAEQTMDKHTTRDTFIYLITMILIFHDKKVLTDLLVELDCSVLIYKWSARTNNSQYLFELPNGQISVWKVYKLRRHVYIFKNNQESMYINNET